MRKDDHLIFEALVQSRAPMSDEQAAKMITDKIKGTPNLNIQNIKMYIQKYLGLVGKAPSDVDFIASMVHDNLQNMGMGENAEDAESADAKKERTQRGWQINKDRWAKWKAENPAAAAKHAARKAGSENAEQYEQNRIVGNDVIQDDQSIGEFLGDSYSSKLTLHGKQMFMPGAPYADTVNQGTHIGLWFKNKRHKLIVKDASKWKEFLSDIVATGDDKYWDGKKMHKHDHIGDEIAATNEYWSKKIAAGADQTPAENAENEPHGYPQGMTAIQNLVLNELKKKGFTLAKISHADKDRDKYPTVFMHKQSGPMHTVAEIDGMGYINGEHYKDYMANLKDGSEDAEGRSRAQQAAIAISLQKAGKKPS